MVLPENPAEQEEIFNSIKTYVVFVAPDLEERFKENYNIIKTNKGRILKRRFKNFGA